MKKLFTAKTLIICALLLIGVFVLPKYFPSLKGNGLLLVLLLCPLMHIFMMKSHGNKSGSDQETGDTKTEHHHKVTN